MKDTLSLLKNPIGVIGLFLVLVEAIASMVVIQSSLNDMLNLILVLFIVIFPILVLGVFYLLVTKHHNKLYSPSDYKDEKNFVKTYNSATQSDELVAESLIEDMPKPENMHSGMSEQDVSFVKDTLNSVLSMQKELFVQVKGESSLEAINDAEEKINATLDSYVIKKREKTYKVEISLIKGCHSLASELSDRNYDASIYTFFNEEEKYGKRSDHACIWLGSKIPVEMAIEVIKLSKITFSHLCYIELSGLDNFAPDYVNYEIFIGGATSTARERNLKPLTVEDFNYLYTLKTQDELHNFVNSFR